MTNHSPTAATLGHLFASGDADAIRLACARLRPFLREHKGNLTHVSHSAGVPLRTLMRWVDRYPSLAAEVGEARDLATRA